jgi:hypothetical protein
VTQAKGQRRGHGEDSIYWDPSKNRYVGAVSLGFTPAGTRIRRKVTGRTKAEVRGKLRELHQEVDIGLRPRQGYTVNGALDDWLAHGLDGVSARTVTLYKGTIVPVWILSGLAVIALWLWMVQANGQGQNWARILSTVLFGLATLQLRGAFTQPVSHAGISVTVLYSGATLLFVAAWLAGAAAVWLLWRPASRVFFNRRARPRPEGPALNRFLNNRRSLASGR